MNFEVHSIGVVRTSQNEYFIDVKTEYKAALMGLEGFGYVQVIWWCDGCDNMTSRAKLTEAKPYVCGPEQMGVFATRSPERPNPIAITTAYVTFIDYDKGVLGLAWIDANDKTPVLDIKPYTPSVDRVENPIVPDWCAHWPKNVETSDAFDWDAEFNFEAGAYEPQGS